MNADVITEPSADKGRRRRPSRPKVSGQRQWSGLLFGIAAVMGWASFNVGSMASLEKGLTPNDLTMLRYGVSALICLPFVLHAGVRDIGGLGWRRAALLALTAGPLFGGLVNAAMTYAPLSHAATVVPAASMLGSMVTGRWLLGEPVAPVRWLGAAIMIAGLALLVIEGAQNGSARAAWFGDLLFLGAAALWTAYTFLLRKWAIDPVLAVSAVNVLSGLAYLPAYLIGTGGRIAWHGDALDIVQAMIVQGVVAAFLTVYAYSQSVRKLGAATAAVFPAAVAPVALGLGAVVLHSLPTPLQLLAVAISIVGIVAAVGVRQ